jgi:hypothetical protein
LYLTLLERRPDLAPWLSVGENVKLLVGQVGLVVGKDVVETLREDEIDALGRQAAAPAPRAHGGAAASLLGWAVSRGRLLLGG